MKPRRGDRPARGENGLEFLRHGRRTVLDRGGIMPRPRKLANARVTGASRFTIGPLGDIISTRV
jgi:hypothetical protein